MFKCGNCFKSVGPNVKPVIAPIGSRQVEYKNTITVLDEYEREQKKTIESRGTEILAEVKLCPPCSGVKEEAPLPTPAHLQRLFASRKPFEENLAPPLRPKLIAVVIHNALERTNHMTRRAKQEVTGTVATIKEFVDNNPKLVF